MSSGKSTPHNKRTGHHVLVAFSAGEKEALDAHCKRTKATRTAVVRRAIRKELGLPEPKEDT